MAQGISGFQFEADKTKDGVTGFGGLAPCSELMHVSELCGPTRTARRQKWADAGKQPVRNPCAAMSAAAVLFSTSERVIVTTMSKALDPILMAVAAAFRALPLRMILPVRPP